MPHVTIKLWPGRSQEQKRELSDAILRDVTSILGYGDQSVSVGFQEVSPQDWMKDVYDPDIIGNWDGLTKEPGYGPRAGGDRS